MAKRNRNKWHYLILLLCVIIGCKGEKINMQKLRFVNANGVELDLTSGYYGITKWNGFSNANLNLQTQQVPYQDGSVFIDGLLNNRELSVTLCINDNNDLAKRYELRNELIKTLNPKLGEGYLYYKNDFLERRIKVIPQLPVIPNKNSNESGTVKASLSWTACGVYWEDVEETSVNLQPFETMTINNEGDVPCPVKIEADTWNIPAYSIKNDSQKIDLRNIQNCDKISINTNQGEKKVLGNNFDWKLRLINTQIYDITYSSELGIFIAVGASGTIITSPDGVTWTQQTSGVTTVLNKVIFSKKLGIFCIVCDVGTILTSPDGITWTQQTSGVTTGLYDVTYSETLGVFCVVGGGVPSIPNENTILTSTDGITWTQQTSGISTYLNKVTYSKTLCIFISAGYNGKILTSPDGVTWTQQTSGVTNTLNSIIYSEISGIFCVVGNGTVLISYNGMSWNIIYNIFVNLQSVTYSEILGLFCAVGQGGGIVTSPDGITWTKRTTLSATFYDVIYCETLEMFIAVGTYFSNDVYKYFISTSSNGISWTTRLNVTGGRLLGITYNSNLNILCATSDRGVVYTSSDGTTWSSSSGLPNAYMWGINYSDTLNIFCAVGDYGRIYTSSDGVTWTQQTSGVSTGLHGITYSSELGIFIAVGASGTILTSPDGVTWTQQTSGVTTVLNKVIFSKKLGIFCIVCDDIILTNIIMSNLNIISHLSTDSDMTFSLQPGENNLLVYNTQRVFNTKLTYRQRYVGL